MGEVIPFNRAERRRRERDAQAILKKCHPQFQQAAQELTRMAVEDVSQRLLAEVLQTLHDSFGWTDAQLGEFVSALDARGYGEVKPSEQQPSQDNPTPGGQADQSTIDPGPVAT